MWWIYALAAGLTLVNTFIALRLIAYGNDAGSGPARRRHPRPGPPRPRGARPPARRTRMPVRHPASFTSRH